MVSQKLPFTVFQYTCHLEFLQDSYHFIHEKDGQFSYEKIAQLGAFKSRTEVRNLIKGLKTAEKSHLCKFAVVLNLEEQEKEYLIALSQLSQSVDYQSAFTFFEKLNKIRKQNTSENPFKEIEIATSVLHMTLLSVFDMKSAPSCPKKIAKLLKNRYNSSEIQNAIEELRALRFIKWSDSLLKWVGCQKHIKKYDFSSNIYLKNFHEKSMEVALDSLQNETTSERYLVGASFAINQKILPRVIQKMNSFLENLMQLENVLGHSDTVIQVNQQMIKMTINETGLGPSGLSEISNSNTL